MGFLSGSLSVTRFTVSGPDPDFDLAPFHEIQPGSEVRESIGFVPFEPEAPWNVGLRRWAFRIRVDRLKPEAAAVRERFKELERTELETTGFRYLGARKRKELRQLAEEELLVRATPRTRLIEGVVDGRVLYLGTTAKNAVGLAILQLRKAGLVAEYHTPWSAAGLASQDSEILPLGPEPASVHGCRCLKGLVGDEEVLVEPVTGRVKLATREARITLAGEVLKDLLRYLEEGAEVLAAKLQLGDLTFTLDAPNFRLQSVRLPAIKADPWTERLDQRLERLKELFDVLDGKFRQVVKT